MNALPSSISPIGPEPQVIVEKLSFGYATELYHGLSFSAVAGEMIALVGPSGSGKSTLLGLICGWEKPSSGTITAVDISSTTWIFQNPIGLTRRTVLDNVTQPLIMRGMDRSEADVQGLRHLRSVGLEMQSNQMFSSLSGGEAQRLMLARSLSLKPDLLLVDEPTAQLDRTAAATVCDVLETINQANTIVIIASHDPLVTQRCTRIVEIGSDSDD